MFDCDDKLKRWPVWQNTLESRMWSILLSHLLQPVLVARNLKYICMLFRSRICLPSIWKSYHIAQLNKRYNRLIDFPKSQPTLTLVTKAWCPCLFWLYFDKFVVHQSYGVPAPEIWCQFQGYESLSDVGEIWVWFASKILTPCRMHWNAFLIAQIIAKCHSFPNMYGML